MVVEIDETSEDLVVIRVVDEARLLPVPVAEPERSAALEPELARQAEGLLAMVREREPAEAWGARARRRGVPSRPF